MLTAWAVEVWIQTDLVRELCDLGQKVLPRLELSFLIRKKEMRKIIITIKNYQELSRRSQLMTTKHFFREVGIQWRYALYLGVYVLQHYHSRVTDEGVEGSEDVSCPRYPQLPNYKPGTRVQMSRLRHNMTALGCWECIMSDRRWALKQLMHQHLWVQIWSSVEKETGCRENPPRGVRVCGNMCIGVQQGGWRYQWNNAPCKEK